MVTTHPDSSEIYRIVYLTPELQTTKRFLATSSQVLSYVEDILTSMRYDVDPFENIQVSTAIHPIVMYHVSDMDESSTRDLILNMLRDSMRFNTRLVPR